MWFWLVAVLARAAEPVSWVNLEDALDQAWEGAGAGWATREAGALAARRAVPTGLHSLFVQLEPDPRSGSHPLEGTQVALQVSLGRQRAVARDRWASEAAAVAAGGAQARLAFDEAAREAWLDAWVGLEMAEHLDSFAGTYADRLQTLRDAASAGLIAPSVLADLEVEVGRLRQEASDARVHAADAEARLSMLLGRSIEVDPRGMPDLEADLTETADPWPAVAARIAAHPEVRALEAEAERARLAAREAGSNPILAGVGASVRGGTGDGPQGVPLVLLQVPLSAPRGSEVRQLRAESQALDQDRAWTLRRLQAGVAASSASWVAAVERVRNLQVGTEGPLRARVARLENAVATGAIDAAPLILAVRDLHDAHHAHALAVADLVGRRAQAEVLLSTLTPGAP